MLKPKGTGLLIDNELTILVGKIDMNGSHIQKPILLHFDLQNLVAVVVLQKIPALFLSALWN